MKRQIIGSHMHVTDSGMKLKRQNVMETLWLSRIWIREFHVSIKKLEVAHFAPFWKC